ncbi:DUF167 domain-containing protein [Roseospirillum parvum]|uniref:UPF0235 protein SAMN05421742_103105 n=1 Tax=Roseospirillum parvum TaxID=83401 RepID=A0A1G7XUX9_9PROT|nr:DUF167 domain-containing protein [Roseospirillum parvum]SDG87967.1 hypothetical protein SAMN05421742_103105 [Roseospirillum parvum]
MDDLPISPAGDGVRLRVKLAPRASRNALGAIAADADGRALLKCSVTAPPADGAANAALVRLLAKSLDLPKSAITITAGQSDRLKTLHLAGAPEELMRRLPPLLGKDRR